MNKGKFIIAKDNETANQLIKEGFIFAYEIGGKKAFYIGNMVTFENIDQNKIIYTDKMII